MYYNWRRCGLFFTFNVSPEVQYRRAGLWHRLVWPRCILEMFHFSSFTVLPEKKGEGLSLFGPREPWQDLCSLEFQALNLVFIKVLLLFDAWGILLLHYNTLTLSTVNERNVKSAKISSLTARTLMSPYIPTSLSGQYWWQISCSTAQKELNDSGSSTQQTRASPVHLEHKYVLRPVKRRTMNLFTRRTRTMTRKSKKKKGKIKTWRKCLEWVHSIRRPMVQQRAWVVTGCCSNARVFFNVSCHPETPFIVCIFNSKEWRCLLYLCTFHCTSHHDNQRHLLLPHHPPETDQGTFRWTCKNNVTTYRNVEGKADQKF